MLLRAQMSQVQKEVMITKDGPSVLTGVLALLMVKPKLDGVLLLDLSMEQ